MTTNTHPANGWRTSTFSGNNGGNCVEVKFAGVMVFIRDSKYLRNPANDPDTQPIIKIPADRWPPILDLALTKASGDIVLNDAAGPKDILSIRVQTDGGATVQSSSQGAKMIFTPDEWDDFAKGIADDQFTLR